MYLKLSLLIILVPLSVHALLRGLSVEVTGDRRLTITTLDNLAERRKAGEAALYIPTGPDGSARGIWIELSSDERGSYKCPLRGNVPKDQQAVFSFGKDRLCLEDNGVSVDCDQCIHTQP